MAIGENVGLKDRLIKKTAKEANVNKESNISKESNVSKVSNTSKESNTSKRSITNNISKKNIKNKFGQPSMVPGTTTYKTKKMTFYVKDDLLKKLYNFAYWDRHSVTEAINIILTDGLKDKNTKEIKNI